MVMTGTRNDAVLQVIMLNQILRKSKLNPSLRAFSPRGPKQYVIKISEINFASNTQVHLTIGMKKLISDFPTLHKKPDFNLEWNFFFILACSCPRIISLVFNFSHFWFRCVFERKALCWPEPKLTLRDLRYVQRSLRYFRK